MLRIPTVLLLLGSLSLAQAPNSADLEQRAELMVNEALRSEGAYALLSRLCHTAPKRITGSPGAAAAVEWARQEMVAMGLDSVSLMPVKVPRWSRGTHCRVALLGARGGPLRSIALGGSVATDGDGLEGEVIEILDFRELKRRRPEIKGKIVFFNRPFDITKINTGLGYGGAVTQRTRGAIEASKLGAIGVVIRSVTSRPDDVPHTGSLRYRPEVPKIPAAALSVVAAERLHSQLSRGPVQLHMSMDCKTLPDVMSANVVGEIRGRSRPEEVVLIGAHLDAWDVGQGAHDDGAGVSHCLEAARLILATGKRPARTLRIVLFMNEENGLAGGHKYATLHADSVAQHIVAIETDSGGFAPRDFGITAGPGAVEALAPISEILKRYGLLGVKRGGGGADISPLGEVGVPTVGMKVAPERYFDFHHSEKDRLEAVHPRELSLGAAALAIFAHGIADSEIQIPRRAKRGGR